MSSRDVLRQPLPLARVTLGLIVAVAVVLSATLVFLGDQSAGAAAGDETVLAQEDASSDEDDEAVIAAASIDVTYDVFLSRDPFESIRPAEPAVTEEPAEPAGPTTPPGTDQATDSNGTAPTAPDEPVCRTGTEAVCDGTVVVLKDISEGQVHTEVNGTEYVVAVGDRFASNFQVLRLDGQCVDFLYLNGDEAEVFSLCEGDTVAK